MSAPRAIGVKRRAAGTAADACAKAFAEAGGVARVEAETGIKARRLYAAADPDTDHGDKPLTWREVHRLERDLGITAFSDALVALHGGVVLAGDDTRDAAFLKAAFTRGAQAAILALMEGRADTALVELEAALRAGAGLRAALTRGSP